MILQRHDAKGREMSHARSGPHSFDLDRGDEPRTAGSERRRLIRTATHGEPSRRQLVTLILGTYAEIPGLSVDLHRAARLFGLRETTCRVVLDDLVRDGRICFSADRLYRAACRHTLEAR